MDIGQLLLTVFLVLYTNHIIEMIFNKSHRLSLQQANIKLDEYRTKPIKSIQEQKEFLDLKFPKKTKPFKFSFKFVFSILITIIKFLITFKIWSYILYNYFKFTPKIWQSLLLIIILTYIINYILNKFNLQKNSLNDIINIGGKK